MAVIFIDTGALLARYLANDQHHKAAMASWDKIRIAREACITSNFVLDETFTLLARRASYTFAAEKARIIYESNALKILRPDSQTELAALDLFEKFADQEISFTDCTSFVLMRSTGIRQAFSFDAHFERAGFRKWK
jgi:predicted nucleic acid-binding protein